MKPLKFPFSLPAPLRLIRMHHWIKSGFVAAPLFFTPSVMSGPMALRVLLGMLAWSLLASAVYVLNDWRDVENDRQHPTKKNRPLASGEVSPRTAGLMLVALTVGAFALAATLGQGFALCLLAYGVLNIAYSLRLKHVAIIDVMIIAVGFVLRVEAGAQLIDVEPSAWIIILTFLLALFLGFAKRRDDIVRALGAEHRRSLDGYSQPYLDTILGVTLGTALVAYLMYTTDPQVMARLGSTNLFYTSPFVVYAMLRYLQLAIVKERAGSPTAVVLTDKPIIIAGLGWVLTFAWLMYK